MQPLEIKEFRKTNGLTQQQLADYLCVSRSFIAQVEIGKSNLPSEKVSSILTNDRGWDTSMIASETPSSGKTQEEGANMQIGTNTYRSEGNQKALMRALEEIGEQRKLVAKSQEQIDRLLAIIENMRGPN